MPKVDQIQIRGVEQISASLSRLERRTRTKYVRKAVRRGANLIRDEARLRVRKRSGALESRIVSSSDRSRDRSIIKAKVHVRGGPAAVKYHKRLGRTNEQGLVTKRILPRRYAHLIEFGSKRAPAYPFMRPAVDFKKGEVPREIAVSLREDLRKGEGYLL